MRHFTTVLAVLALGAATSAAAQEMKVKYKDLDLATDQGQKVLTQRIENAARSYCRDSGETGTRNKTLQMECLANARNAARQQIAAVTENALKGG